MPCEECDSGEVTECWRIVTQTRCMRVCVRISRAFTKIMVWLFIFFLWSHVGNIDYHWEMIIILKAARIAEKERSCKWCDDNLSCLIDSLVALSAHLSNNKILPAAAASIAARSRSKRWLRERCAAREKSLLLREASFLSGAGGDPQETVPLTPECNQPVTH